MTVLRGKGPFEEEQFGNKLWLCHPGRERGRTQLGRGGLNSKDPWETEGLGQVDRRRECESEKGVYSRCPAQGLM